jgi:ankyrin repeat protein
MHIPVRQVTFLIQGAIFRPRCISMGNQERLSLQISSLGELIDMYHRHEATESIDKIYALLGMCSDDLSATGLAPDYDLSMGETMQRLIKFLLGSHISAMTWDYKEIAVIRSKGSVLGKVSPAGRALAGSRGKKADVTFEVKRKLSRYFATQNFNVTLQSTSQIIEDGDLVCLLEGVRRPTIVRLFNDHFTVIAIAALPPKHIQTAQGNVDWTEFVQIEPYNRIFVLLWDWDSSAHTSMDPHRYDALIQAGDLQSQCAGTESASIMSAALRRWNNKAILEDAEDFGKAEGEKQKAMEQFNRVRMDKHSHSLQCPCGDLPLLWAAEHGDATVLQMLLAKDDVEPDSRNYLGRTPLSLAAENGHVAVVGLLVKQDNVDVDSQDPLGRTPLLYAAMSGQEAIVRILLERDDVNADWMDNYELTPLSWAATNGHEAIVKLLVDRDDVTADSKDRYNRTPLSYAAENGHEPVFKLLLEREDVKPDLIDSFVRTPLSYAAMNGHETIVRHLVERDNIEVDSKDKYGTTPLSWAATHGHEAIVKLLIKRDDVNPHSRDRYGRSPLLLAAEHRHEKVVKLLKSVHGCDSC